MVNLKNLGRDAALKTFLIGVFFLCSSVANAHELKGKATYLANEGLMVQAGEYKVLFDPYFHNDYGHYQLVPKTILAAIMSNTAPYNNINATQNIGVHLPLAVPKFLKASGKKYFYVPGETAGIKHDHE